MIIRTLAYDTKPYTYYIEKESLILQYN